MSEDKKLGLGSVVSISVGLVIATSCLVSLGQGAGTVGVVFIFSMIIACLLNMTTVASLSELNAIMPNTTGGLAQYTLACLGPFPTLISMVGGYLLCNILSSGVEASIFSYAMAQTIKLPIPSIAFGPVFPVIGIVGTCYMILNISSDPVERNMIWLVVLIAFLVLAVYSFWWIKTRMKMPVFKSVPIQKVMAMENELFYTIRKRRGIWR